VAYESRLEGPSTTTLRSSEAVEEFMDGASGANLESSEEIESWDADMGL
jgi:hypothetical protein